MYSFQHLLQVWPERLLRKSCEIPLKQPFIHSVFLLTNVIKHETFSILNVVPFYHLQIKYYKVTSLLRLSTLVPDSIQYVKFCPSVPRHLTMACLSIVAQLDGFQHVADAFFLKALALVDLRTGLYQLRRFDSTDLLNHSRDHGLTYRVQSAQHGWHLNSAGLPQCAAETALLPFLQDALLNAFEVGQPVPSSIVLWAKELQSQLHLSTLAPFLLPVPVLVKKNLEDLDCPLAKRLTQLKPEESPTTVPKALAFAKRLNEPHLA